MPLIRQIRCQPLLHHLGLSSCHAIDRVDQGCEVLALLVTSREVLVLLLLLLVSQHLLRRFVTVGARVRVRDPHIEDAQAATLPESMDPEVATRLVDIIRIRRVRSRLLLLLLLTRAALSLLPGRLLLLLLSCRGLLSIGLLCGNLLLTTSSAGMDGRLALDA